MDSSIKKRILIIITNSYAATNVIHSGLIKPLAEEFDIHILSDIINDKEISEINNYYNIKITKLYLEIPIENQILKTIRLIQKLIFFHVFQIETQKIKDQNKFKSSLPRLLLNLSYITGINKLLLIYLRKLIIIITIKRKELNLLNNSKFNGVISTSPLDIRENIIINFLNKINIRSLAMVISWDNLTSKGIINADHHYVLVWNTIMAEEYCRFYSMYNCPDQKICITGIPRFDIYFEQIKKDNNIVGFFSKFNFTIQDKIILFATSSKSHFPNQVDIVRHLLEYISLHQNIRLLVRCHQSDNHELYDEFKNESNVRIWHQKKDSAAFPNQQQMPALDMLTELKCMLDNCSVCVNVASTMRLEVALSNKPGISIAYDGDLNLPFKDSVRRFYNYSHQLPLNELEIDKTVFSKKELFKVLDEVLSPDFSPNDTRSKIQKFTHHPGADAVPATLNYIRQWLN